jgi:WD40 repeat protein
MAPERFEGWSDRRSDVYSLGATLYELVTLRPLFGSSAHAELIERVLHDPPEAPRRIDPRIPRDLEAIVLKAIAKEPGDRYAAAQAMGEDLQRFLEDRPILARRSTTVEQGWRWCPRNPLLVVALTTAAVAVVTLAIAATVMAWKFREQRDQIAHDLAMMRLAEARDRRARVDGRHEELVEALLDRARAKRLSRQPGQRFDSLAALAQAAEVAREMGLPPERLESLRDEAIACLALPDLRPEPEGLSVHRRTAGVAYRFAGQIGRHVYHPNGPSAVMAFAFDPSLARYAFGFRDGTIAIRRVADDQVVARFQAPGGSGFGVFTFSPDGRYLAAAQFPGEALAVWDVRRRAAVVRDPGPVHDRAQFSPDSRRIALARADGDVLVYDLETRQPERHWHVPRPGPLAFRFDAARIAVLSNGDRPTCRILETATGRLVWGLPLRASGYGVAWSPDGTKLSTPARIGGSISGTPTRGSGRPPWTGIATAACAPRSTPPARCWPAADGRVGSGSGTRSWAAPGSTWSAAASHPSSAGTGESWPHSRTGWRPTWSIRRSNTGRSRMPATSRSIMERWPSGPMAGCWPWARAGAWRCGIWPAAARSRFCRATGLRTCDSRPPVTC